MCVLWESADSALSLPSICVCVCMGGLHAVTAVSQLFILKPCRCEQNQEDDGGKKEQRRRGLTKGEEKVTQGEFTLLCVCVCVCTIVVNRAEKCEE